MVILGRLWRGCALALLMVLPAAFAACGGDAGDPGVEPPSGPARSFMMGFSSLPRELNADAYQEAIEFADTHGDLVLIQRSVPWSDFTPGAEISDETARNTSSEIRAIDDNDLRSFFAIDPTDGATGRDRLSNLPVSLSGKRFDDGDVRAAFVSYAEYVALNYEPDYMALGVEMNLYYAQNAEDFENFKTLYAQAYEAVKAKSPKTQITVTLQYEDLQGLLPREDRHFADWQLVTAFEPRTDFTAISTYPSFAFPNAAAIPENYYSQLRAFTDKPIAIAEMGYATTAGAQGVNSGTESDQSAFVERIIDEAEDLAMPFVVWFAIWDPTYARDTAFGAFESIGLLRDDDTEKPAWQHWANTARRPYEP
ncbi:MAG: hypothetical protein WD359_04585 [Dehalococcoidia bacterium]